LRTAFNERPYDVSYGATVAWLWKNSVFVRIYFCSCCGLTFKNEKSMVRRSIFLPGGGYFYTGHPLVAILPAIVEAVLVLELLAFVFAGLTAPQAVPNLLSTVVILGVFWGLETAATILHCRRYVRDYIPEKRDPARARQEAAVKVSG
jgi:hypothetical protein